MAWMYQKFWWSMKGRNRQAWHFINSLLQVAPPKMMMWSSHETFELLRNAGYAEDHKVIIRITTVLSKFFWTWRDDIVLLCILWFLGHNTKKKRWMDWMNGQFLRSKNIIIIDSMDYFSEKYFLFFFRLGAKWIPSNHPQQILLLNILIKKIASLGNLFSFSHSEKLIYSVQEYFMMKMIDSQCQIVRSIITRHY